jgi:hypothetical protein
MFTDVDGTMVLVGIVSTVTVDLASNGIVPLQSLHELLRHPEKYWHEATAHHHAGGGARVIRS